MIKAYKINYHSFIDVITNSSTEMFINTDKKIVNFFHDLFTEEEQDYHMKVLTFKEYSKEYDLEYVKENDIEDYNTKYGNLKPEDRILVLNLEYQSDDTISKILNKLNFISIYD